MNIKKAFAKYVSQNILGMLGVSIYIIADTFFISKAAGTDGLAVLNLALPIYGLIFAIGSMVGVGSATRFAISRSAGEKNSHVYFSNAIFCLFILSLPFIIAGSLAPGLVLKLMGGNSHIIKTGIPYVRTFMCFTPFFMQNYVFTAFVRNDNSPSIAMLATLCGSLFNIVFDYVFMFPMKMGLMGAALATGASPIIGILISSSHFLSKKNTIRFALNPPSFNRLIKSCRLGISAFVGEMSSSVTTATFNFLILGLLGTNGNIGVAAYGVIANLALMATAIFNGIAQGLQPLLSQFYGRGEKANIKKSLKLGLATALIIAGVLVLVSFAFTDSFISIFNSQNSKAMRDYAFLGLRLYFLGYLFAGVNIIITGYFGATNRAHEAFLSSISRGFVAIIASSIILSRIFGLNGVWMSFAVSEALTLILELILIAGKKEKNNESVTSD